MTHWRPKGWLRQNAKHHPWHCFAPDACVGDSFEAGADAMLKALRSNQWCPYDLSVLKVNYKGKVVIVPDDE